MRHEIKVYRNLMGANDEWADKTRNMLRERGIRMLNLIGSPGAGKTALLEALALRRNRPRFAVLEGDCATTHDAERLHRLGTPVSQLLTDGGCHLQAKMVHHALLDLPLEELDLVIVENVGNLVCPAEFDIGENDKVAILSVTEGEDKPVKYPMLFRNAAAIVLTKIDLLPYLPFQLDRCVAYVRQVNPDAPLFQVSALKGDGLEEWTGWVANGRREAT